MSLEHSPAKSPRAAVQPAPGEGPPDYWFALVNEKEAGRFLDLGIRTMQKYRQTGNGPRYVRLSGRCVKYRRFDCNVWNESRLRASTSDPGPGDER